MSIVDPEELKEKIKRYAVDLGFDKIGFTDTSPLTEFLPRLLRRAGAGYRHALHEGDPHKRISPKAFLPGAKSVISLALAYPATDRITASGDCHGRGRFSFISRGMDYHVVVADKLGKLKGFLLEQVPGAHAVVMVDREELLEKAFAVKAGLGWFGKNTLLVTPEYGSWVCLGEVITDIPLPADTPCTNGCGECRACVAACPTGALDEEGNLNPDRCVSALTQSKHLPGHETRELMGTTLYGCDICQQACPCNRAGQPKEHPEFKSSYDDEFPILSEIFSLTNRGFRERFGHLSGAWRGRTTLQRNAVIAAGNLGEPAAVPELAKILSSDKRVVMRTAAAWALGRIGGPDSKHALEQAELTEGNPEVLEEIRFSLRER